MTPDQIPKTFRLAQRTWRVKWVKGLKAPDGCMAYGLTDGITATITLDAGMLNGPKEHLMHTWEHELLHAMLYGHGVFFDHDERMVDGLAGMRRQYALTARGSAFPSQKKGATKAPRKRKA